MNFDIIKELNDNEIEELYDNALFDNDSSIIGFSTIYYYTKCNGTRYGNVGYYSNFDVNCAKIIIGETFTDVIPYYTSCSSVCGGRYYCTTTHLRCDP